MARAGPAREGAARLIAGLRRHLPRLCAVLLCTLLASCAGNDDERTDDVKRACAYSAHSISALEAFGQKVDRDIDCAVIFNNANTEWKAWATPWFIAHGDPDRNWANWVRAKDGRELIITQNLIPDAAAKEDWRTRGAGGEYAEHARTLARNLVRAGMGDSVIRLGHEANGDWFTDQVGANERDWALWARFWRTSAKAMKSVEGANFRFDWTINARYRKIPLEKFYPGDDVVDIVGIDAYDAGVPAGQPNWKTIYEAPLGLRDVARFAARHDKPMSIPEWGVGPVDNPEYVDGIARVVRTNRVDYQAYFSNLAWAKALDKRSLAAYIRHFGKDGDSAGEN